MRLKFKLSHWGFFGIWFSEFPIGHTGFRDSNGWMLCDDAESCYWNAEYHSINTGLPDMSLGKLVEMTYDRQAKRLKISWEGKSFTHVDENLPEEVYFVFSLQF